MTSLLKSLPKYSFQFKKPAASSGHFTQILIRAVRQYIALEQQNSDSEEGNLFNHTLPSGTKFYVSDQKCLVLYDAYPKSRYHLLIVPRDLSILTLRHLKQEHVDLLTHMKALGEEIAKGIQKQDDKHLPTFKMGFHAIPSLDLLHMHVISQDFVSPCLKNKKHWNTFNTEFFVDVQEVIDMLQRDGKVEFNEREYHAMEKRDLQCDGLHFKTMPKLKQYLSERSGGGEE